VSDELAEVQPSAVAALVVDVDGTLIRSDLLLESALAYIGINPVRLWQAIGWLRQGRAQLKAQLARRVTLAIEHLPYEQVVVDKIVEAKAQGRPVVLASASARPQVEAVADHLGLFDDVIASSDSDNIKATRKAEVLIARFGHKGFDYAGNSKDDLPVWHGSRHSHVVNAEFGVRKALANQAHEVWCSRPSQPVQVFAAVPWAQCVSNLLVFVPLLLGSAASPMVFALGWVLLGLVAMAGELLDQLLHLQQDRFNQQWAGKVLATGRLFLKPALLVLCLCLLTAGLLALVWLPLAATSLLVVFGLLLAIRPPLPLARVLIGNVVPVLLGYLLLL
jgi:phosphoserine phosphatase